MIYPELRRDDDIRLLTIEPGNFKPICATLTTFSLSQLRESGQQYSALSYVWGPSTPKISMACNGQPFPITPNLAAAMLRLRLVTETPLLWIDQLCINQDDLNERNRQVSMMGNIYGSAERVYVWLGDEDEDTPMIWSLFCELCKFEGFDRTEVYDHALGDRQVDTAQLAGRLSGSEVRIQGYDLATGSRQLPNLPSRTDPCWRAMKRFFERTWFWRIWAFQEIVLSIRVTIWCGEYYITLPMLNNACIGMDMGGYGRCAEIRETVTFMHQQRDRLQASQRPSLRTMLELNRQRDATEPRDMIYALRGVIEPMFAERIIIDYPTPLGLVYARAARFCMHSEKALTVLGSVEYRRNEKSQAEMPSWVPDWRYRTSVMVDLSMRRQDHSRYYNASNGELLRINASDDERELSLKGFVVATLTDFYDVKSHLKFKHRMGAERFPLERFDQNAYRNLYSNAASAIEFSASSLTEPERTDCIMATMWSKPTEDPLSDAQAVEVAYRRTITADLMPCHNTRLTNVEITSMFAAYVAWQKSGFPSPVPVEVLQEHDYYISQVMTNREFFVAKSESTQYMGITMGVPRDGDCVCILVGGDTPYILRPREDGKWQFIAEAYVHGIMDGEAVRTAFREGVEFQDFVLV